MEPATRGAPPPRCLRPGTIVPIPEARCRACYAVLRPGCRPSGVTRTKALSQGSWGYAVSPGVMAQRRCNAALQPAGCPPAAGRTGAL